MVGPDSDPCRSGHGLVRRIGREPVRKLGVAAAASPMAGSSSTGLTRTGITASSFFTQAQARGGRRAQVRPEGTGGRPASADGHRQGNHGGRERPAAREDSVLPGST